MRRRRKKYSNHQDTINNAPNLICYPPYHSEFEVQAELYKQLSDCYDVRGCVAARCHIGHNHPKVFMDLVVFVNRVAQVVIECKNDGSTGLELKPGTRQHRRYSMFGVPVLKCGSMDAIESVFRRVNEIVTSNWPPTNASFLSRCGNGTQPNQNGF